MKRTKRLISLILIFALLFSTLEMVRFSASTDDTMYSVKHLQNGGFEDNADGYTYTEDIYTQPNKSSVQYWDTTATDGKFEFFKENIKYHFKQTYNNKNYGQDYCKVAEGEIAAELNATQVSTIYQRINTVAGSTYTWGLYHRGRDTTDRMVLFIGPEQYDNSGKAINPSKPSSTGKDQFVRITNWLKEQYVVEFPGIGCSKKYSVYSKPFAASGKFLNESRDENENISLVETEEINQEWSVWIISSPYCNADGQYTQNGWSAYGTKAVDDFDDIIKGAGSTLGYDCTYTIPKGQTKTLFAFCSFESGRVNNTETVFDATYGNLLDGIKFDLYQPISSSITPGGIGSAENESIRITSDITSDKFMHSVVRDGNECTILTAPHDNETLKECNFVGAYVTINNDDGTSTTKFVTPYEKDISGLSSEERNKLAKQYFIYYPITDDDEKTTWDFYYKIPVNSPVSIHLIYTKAPFVLYDSNGGKEYYFSPDNTNGGNLVGFADHFQKVLDKVDEEGKEIYLDTSAYYRDYETVTGGTQDEPTIIPGFYKSHAALPNNDWETNDDGTSPHKFCGWSLLDNKGKQAIIDGQHIVNYSPGETDGGMVSFTDISGKPFKNSEGEDIKPLDATHGITLTALWKFVHRAQAQTYTYNNEGKKWEYVNSAVGGTVEETMIPDDLRGSDVKEYYEDVNGKRRVECVDAAGNAGDKIMFKAKPDYENNYAFVGWYYREKQADGTYKEVLRGTSTSIAVTVEEGKLNTYYARFQKISNPVIFKYTQNGSVDDYDYYDKTDDLRFGKYNQEVPLGATATQPTGDSKNVKIWFTSPTERGTEYVFDFSTPIDRETILYAGPTFAYNYFNFFKLKEPWYINTYGTVKINGKYIDLKTDPNVSDYNVYILKGNLGESAPTPSYIKSNSKIKVGKSVNSEKLIYNTLTLTNTSGEFNRAGTTFSDFYLFNMKTPVWVVFDFTYKGVKYTSTVKDRCLYNNITTYMKEASNKLYTDYPPEKQAELQVAQKTLLKSIQNMYDSVKDSGITEPTPYYAGATFNKENYKPAAEANPYTFESTTAIRNIEPWGLKYSFNLVGQTVTDFADYGAIIMTDTAKAFNESVTVDDLLNNENSVMYSKSKNNIYDGLNGKTEVYYVNNMLALDFDKNTYAVFFVKNREGKTYYSNVVSNSYNSIVESIDENNTSNDAKISKSIMNYSKALINYTNLVKKAESENG